MAVWRILHLCWITKATNTHSEYLVFIAFPLQQWLYERAKFLRTLPLLFDEKLGCLGFWNKQLCSKVINMVQLV